MHRYAPYSLFVLLSFVVFELGILYIDKPTASQIAPAPECPQVEARIPSTPPVCKTTYVPPPAPQPITLPADPSVIAVAGDLTITVDEVQNEINQSPSYLRSRANQVSSLKEIIQQLALRKAMLSEAERKGIPEDPSVKMEIANYRQRLILQKLSQQASLNEVDLPESELKSFYEKHHSEFAAREEVRARHILIKLEPSASPADKVRARRDAESLALRARRGESFESLAIGNSQDPGSASRGGDLGFFPRGRLSKEVEDAAFQMVRPGEISDLVLSPFGYHLIQFVEKKTTEAVSFEKARDQIKQRLTPERQRASYQAFLDNIKLRYPMTVSAAVVEKMAARNAEMRPVP